LANNKVSGNILAATSKNKSLYLLLLLLGIDFIFFLLHAIAVNNRDHENQMLLLTTDGGYAEIYQYLKKTFIIIFLFVTGIRTRLPIYFVLTLIFVYILADDVFRIHETVGGLYLGGFIHEHFPEYSIEQYHLGQICYALPVSLFFLILIWIFYPQNSLESNKIKTILVFLFLFGFAAIGIDALQSFVSFKGSGIVEDGGEMIVISFTAWYVNKTRSPLHRQNNS